MAKKARIARMTPVQVVKRELGVRPLARHLGITARTICRWGDDVPSHHQSAILALAGGRITADEIINGRECNG